MAGAGNKNISIYKGQWDAYVYPSSGVGGWDVCAPEALLKAQFGRATDFDGKPFDFRPGMGPVSGVCMVGRPGYWDEVNRRRNKFLELSN